MAGRLGGRLRREWEARPSGRATHVVTVHPRQERFLDETLESVRRQTYRDGETVVVRWGPGEALPSLAAARNDGLARAGGRYARLVESGDVLPWHSTATLVRALNSGAAGSAAGRSTRGADWRDRAFAPAPGVEPGLGDRLLDLARWRSAVLAFDRDDGGFGDATLAACERALGCSVVDAVTHEDHGRADGLPFGHLRAWSAEADAWSTAVEAALDALGPTGRLRPWAAAVVDHRLPAVLGDVERLDDDRWRRLGSAAGRLLDALGGDAPELARAESRALAWLTAHDRRAEVTELILARWWEHDDLPTTVRDGVVLADLPGTADVPADVRRLGDRETPLVLRPVRRTGSTLSLVGFVRGVETRTPPDLRIAADGRPVTPEQRSTPAATRIAAEAEHCHDGAWIDVEVGDARELTVTLTVAGVTRTGALAVPAPFEPPASTDPRGEDEIGPYAQRALRRWYAEPHPIETDLAYFQAYTGRSATDSPLAIHEALRRSHPHVRTRWLVEHLDVPLPEGAEPVLWRSREWYSTLATARWLVTNIEMERWFRTRPGQTLVQTWHGNPGKTMGLSAWRAAGYTPGRIEQALDHGPRNWSLLVSPSPEMTEHYRREFGYDGPVVDHGYPRDDLLVSPQAAAVRRRARADLGIGDDQTAVLFAPTWRPELALHHRRARMSEHFDLARAATLLGEDYVVLLRGHRFHRERRAAGARVVDVTDHPEVNDLILAADAAVLDYSSIRFDFALTGRPMIFCVPDLEAYLATRGTLYDFRDSAPGPLLTSTDAVVAALRDLDAVGREYADARARFHDRFHRFQDGHAAERVVRAAFGDPGQRR